MRMRKTRRRDKTDRDRPLSERGIAEAQAAAAWLKTKNLLPARILCSPSVRTHQTLQIALGDVEAQDEPRIYEATAGELDSIIDENSDAQRLLHGRPQSRFRNARRAARDGTIQRFPRHSAGRHRLVRTRRLRRTRQRTADRVLVTLISQHRVRRMTRWFFLCAAVLAIVPAMSCHAEDYIIDSARSHAEFDVKVMWLVGIRGDFGLVKGKLSVDRFHGTASCRRGNRHQRAAHAHAHL